MYIYTDIAVSISDYVPFKIRQRLVSFQNFASNCFQTFESYEISTFCHLWSFQKLGNLLHLDFQILSAWRLTYD